MKFYKAKKVVIVAEASIKDSIIKAIVELGVTGYTLQEAEGKGKEGIRSGGDLLGTLFGNIRIEIITNEEIAQKIAFGVMERFFCNYAGIVYTADVEILQAEKFDCSDNPYSRLSRHQG